MQPRLVGGMNDIRPATDLRDAARRRVRRATTMIAASSAVIAGVVAAYVAGAATGQKAVGSTTTPNTQRGEVPVPATPVAPSLDSSAPQQTPTPAQSAPVQPPSQSVSPPVAVSGGS